jgi:FRG domain
VPFEEAVRAPNLSAMRYTISDLLSSEDLGNSFNVVSRSLHSGLATYLLDWTTNPLVALFFACGEERDKDGAALNGEVFVLNNPERVSEEEN